MWTVCIGFACFLSGVTIGGALGMIFKTEAYEKGFKDGRHGYGWDEQPDLADAINPLHAILEARRARGAGKHQPASRNR